MSADGKRQVLTIATGKKIYIDMAVNLARSFIVWHNDSDITFTLVTDQIQHLPEDVKARIQIKEIKQNEFGKGFSPKLSLDRFAGEGQTLFIDSDCLIYGNVSPVFEKFRGHAVSVIGNYISNGEWFGNVASICTKLGVEKLPKFNGGVYYLEQGEMARKVYSKARELEKSYDDIGFVRLRSRPNDEVLVAAAMALNAQEPVPDDGNIFAELLNFRSGLQSDVLAGKARVFNDPNSKLYQPDWPLTKGKPLIIHFLGDKNQSVEYLTEVKHLRYHFVNEYHEALLRTLTFLNTTFPLRTKNVLKNLFRPLFRLLIGTRKVPESERIVE